MVLLWNFLAVIFFSIKNIIDCKTKSKNYINCSQIEDDVENKGSKTEIEEKDDKA